MTDVSNAAWAKLNLGHLSLIVAWRINGEKLDFASIPLAVPVADELRAICLKTLERLDRLEERGWHPDAASEVDEYLLAEISQLGENSESLKAVTREEYEELSPRSLPQREFLFYALICGPTDRRVAFIRKYNLRRGLKQRLIAMFGENLTKIEDPLFTFDERIDIVIDPLRGAAILNLGAYSVLFRSSPDMIARTPEYVEEIAANLPMSAASMLTLIGAALGNMNIHRRLQSIASRGHLSSVSMSQIRDEMKRHHLDVDKFIIDGQLVFDKADSKDILKLLNEDLFRGGLTNQGFQVDRKSPR